MKKPRRNRPPAPVPQPQHNQHINERRQIISAGWSGPLPPPAALDEFNRIVPGGAERIFNQFEAEGAHRRELEQRQSKFLVRDVHIGQFLAGLFAISGLAVAALAIYLDKPWAATVIGGGTIAPIVYAFLRQTWTDDQA
ncbi:DUF2335 domain-containing protein [Afipia sp. Root123D2]|uniref:DUF2335 domain-containing protein n=1 Tax=Afipia sp. Root123D2 TaxID=1736436 RepID=UPI00138EDF59|nr:DUF2335 domain-containing protein [Afipia sp. Root123D2]